MAVNFGSPSSIILLFDCCIVLFSLISNQRSVFYGLYVLQAFDKKFEQIDANTLKMFELKARTIQTGPVIALFCPPLTFAIVQVFAPVSESYCSRKERVSIQEQSKCRKLIDTVIISESDRWNNVRKTRATGFAASLTRMFSVSMRVRRRGRVFVNTRATLPHQSAVRPADSVGYRARVAR